MLKTKRFFENLFVFSIVLYHKFTLPLRNTFYEWMNNLRYYEQQCT